jgi:serine/threonine-protein kinase
VSSLDDGTPYIVMECLDGPDRAAELRQRGTLPPAEAAASVTQACTALAEAHGKGIVHRDIKPANLFLSKAPDGSRLVKVLDFGVAKSLVDTSTSQLALTTATALVGSPLYMSPEQLTASRDVDVRSDIWSLGTVLYELLTGKPPFTGASLPELCTSVMQSEPATFQEKKLSIPAEIEAAVLKALAKKPEERWPDIKAFARALAPFVESPVVASRLQSSLAASGRGGSLLQSAASPPSELPVISQGDTTRDSWGHTRQEGRPVKLPRLWWLAAPVLPLLFVALYLSSRQTTKVDDSPQPVTATSSIEQPEPVASSELPAPVLDTAPEPSAAPPAAEASSVAVPEPPVAPRRPERIAAPTVRAPATPKARASTVRPAPSTAPSAAHDFSDFGGRR